jgi:hypothetical protein
MHLARELDALGERRRRRARGACRVGRGGAARGSAVMDLVLLFVILVVLGFSVLAVGLLLTMET